MGAILGLSFVVVILAILIGAWYFSEKTRIRRALREAPRARIADAPEGKPVRIDGPVANGEVLTAPLTGRACVFYEAIVEEYVSNGKSGSWRQRVRERRGVPFVVDDGSGRAVVDPTGARVDVDLDSTSRSGTFDDATEIEERFLARHGLKSTGWVFNRKLRYREGVIEVGERVAVMGAPVREPDPDAASRVGGYRDGPPTRLRLGGSARQPILLSDSRDVTSS